MYDSKTGGSFPKIDKVVSFEDELVPRQKHKCQPEFFPTPRRTQINYDDGLVKTGSKKKSRKNSDDEYYDQDNQSKISTDSQSKKRPHKSKRSKSRDKSRSKSGSNKRHRSLEHCEEVHFQDDQVVSQLKYQFYNVLQNSDYCEHEQDHGKRLLNRWISTRDNEAKILLLQWLREGLDPLGGDKNCDCCKNEVMQKDNHYSGEECCGNPDCKDHMHCEMYESRPRTRDPCNYGNARSSAYFHKNHSHSMPRINDHNENVMSEDFVAPCHFRNKFNKQKIDYYMSKSYEKLKHDIKQKKQEKE